MTQNPLRQLHDAGQSVWLDFIDRRILRDGTLQRLIRDDALAGMTSNPTIFDKALAEGSDYDSQIAVAADLAPAALFELLETDDVRTACDAFAPLHASSGGTNGLVSIEVSPAHAHDAAATISEAHRLWKTVGRPNLMIKVPGTPEGAVAIRRLIAEGLNVNVTLLFSVEAHASVIEAYLEGLEDRVRAGQPVDGLASVASFFVSRVDTEVDKRLEALANGAGRPTGRERLLGLRGQAAIANAKHAYRLFRERFSGARWEALAAHGAHVQRPLWASTSTKNPVYRDVMYVEELIGPDTVNTIPPATMDAFRDHGQVVRRVDQDLDGADRLMAALGEAGVSFSDVTAKLLADGIASFQKSFDSVVDRVSRKAALVTTR